MPSPPFKWDLFLLKQVPFVTVQYWSWGLLHKTMLASHPVWTWGKRQQVRDKHGRGLGSLETLTLEAAWKIPWEGFGGKDPSSTAKGPWRIVNSGMRNGQRVARDPTRLHTLSVHSSVESRWSAYTHSQSAAMWSHADPGSSLCFSFYQLCDIKQFTFVASLEHWDKNLHQRILVINNINICKDTKIQNY